MAELPLPTTESSETPATHRRNADGVRPRPLSRRCTSTTLPKTRNKLALDTYSKRKETQTTFCDYDWVPSWSRPEPSFDYETEDDLVGADAADVVVVVVSSYV